MKVKEMFLNRNLFTIGGRRYLVRETLLEQQDKRKIRTIMKNNTFLLIKLLQFYVQSQLLRCLLSGGKECDNED